MLKEEKQKKFNGRGCGCLCAQLVPVGDPIEGAVLEPMLDEDSFVCLVPEMAIYEAKAMCERLEKAGARFALEELPEEKVYAYSNHPGRGGLSTRLRLNVHPDDCDRAQPIIAAVLKILP